MESFTIIAIVILFVMFMTLVGPKSGQMLSALGLLGFVKVWNFLVRTGIIYILFTTLLLGILNSLHSS
jgi:hypothetical protein